MKTSVDISLGTAPELYQLFSYASAVVPLTDVISHSFNQTLERDMIWGGWANAYIKKGGEYRLKLSSPAADLTRYTELIPRYLDAGRLALQTFNAKITNGNGMQFLLPFGLAMANVRSVQLFHFPPSETSSYSDYLYSPTNQRWEALLIENKFDGRERTLLERIIDLVPIAAAGGAGQSIDAYNDDFTAYVRRQLAVFLTSHHPSHTPPVVAMGGPVRQWLRATYKLKRRLEPLSLLTLSLVPGRQTHVLCANHPSQYLYDTNKSPGDAHKLVHDVRWQGGKEEVTTSASPYTVMRQDLIAAGWQAAMSRDWAADPARTLREVSAHWTDPMVHKVIQSQNQEFGFAR